MRGLRVTSDWHRFIDGLPANDAAPMGVALDFIEDTRESGLVLVHLGDMVQGWNGISIPRIVMSNNPIFEALASLAPQPVLITGNHDGDPTGRSLGSVLWQDYGLEMSDFYFDWGIGCLHGHLFDEYNAPGKIVGWLISRLCGVLERRVHSDIDLWWNKIARKVPAMRSDVNYPAECAKLTKEGAVDDLDDLFGGLTTIFFGHTHRRGHWNIDGVDIYNPGHAVNRHFQYFDFIDGQFQGFRDWPLH